MREFTQVLLTLVIHWSKMSQPIMPTISVVIPAYNAEKTILETIESVRQQTFTDFELIVIDDGSSDHTAELINAIADDRLRLFSYENGGLSIARNRGIDRASGEFIAFLDADDLWTPDKLELQLEALQKHPDAGGAYSWTIHMSQDGKMINDGGSVHFEGNVYSELLVSNFLTNGSNPLIRRTAIESVSGFDPALASAEDWEYWLRLAAQWSFVRVPKRQIFYRHSSTSMSNKVDVTEKYNVIVINRAFKSAPQTLQHLKNRSLANVYQYLTGLILADVKSDAQVKLGGQKLWTAIRLDPRILLNKITRRYLMKWVLMTLLPPRFVRRFARPFRRQLAASDLSHQS